MQESTEYHETAFAHGVEVWGTRPQHKAVNLPSRFPTVDGQIGIATVVEKAGVLSEEAMFDDQGGLTATQISCSPRRSKQMSWEHSGTCLLFVLGLPSLEERKVKKVIRETEPC